MALEQPKKPAGGAFGVFMNEKRPEFIKALPGQPVSAVSKMGGGKWKGLSDAQRVPYQKKYEEKKAKFEKDMAAFLAAGGVKQKGATALRSEKRKAKEGKKKKDPNAPKQPAGGGYGVFFSENRESITKSLPAGHKMTDVGKAGGEKWRSMSEAQKKPYVDKFEKKREAYKAALAEYKKTLPADEADEDDEEEDDDDEEDEEEEASEPAPKKAKPSASGATDASVLEEAKKLGFNLKFKNLSENAKLSGTPSQKILDALKTAQGSVVVAKKALLGA